MTSLSHQNHKVGKNSIVERWNGEAPSPHTLNCHRGEALANIFELLRILGGSCEPSLGFAKPQQIEQLCCGNTSGKNSIAYEENRIAE